MAETQTLDILKGAILLEHRGKALYESVVKSSESEDEKNLYNWLTEWEKNHMLMLARLDNELKEKIWYDNQFWPLD